ncbi:hypothetical protein [Wolbachia endosymbiont (group A) of Andrena hattorfiana]|uniref:hypothetical protein n=1 Tax=Wolbachia endosymbiont (group A) of Andrena hattorfiana TaxID=2953977 RepID=UPI0021F860AD|nr:hypothetical protein [Wolbachia endosymbiont (group A) of Andrena hattorfiana]
MVIGQQQLTGKIATRYNTIQLLRSSTLKQKSLSDKISDVGVSGLIDDTVKLSRSKRDMGKGIYYSVIFMYRAYRLVDKLGWKRGLQVVNRYLGIKRGREIVVDLIDKALEGKDIMDTIEDLRRTGLFKTNGRAIYRSTASHRRATSYQKYHRLQRDGKLQQKFHRLQKDSRLQRIIAIHLYTVLLYKVI